jgi:hypothetical protein
MLVPGQQLVSEQLFQTLDLQTDGGLRAIEQAGSGGDAAGVNDGNKGTQECDVDVALRWSLT